jgi:2-hydroxychromene-2-carboxylate isomerase
MSAPIEFWFDFTSPYSYIAAEMIDDLAARRGRSVDWQPMLLGVIFKSTGAVPLIDIPVKGEYSRIDFERSARFHDLPYRMPDKFPLGTQNAARAVLWLTKAHPTLAHDFARAVFRALFTANRDVSDTAVLVEIAQQLGIDADALTQAIAAPEIKDALKRNNEIAMQKKIFGAPTVFVDGEMFWGADRLPQVEHWLKKGGF